MNADSTFQIGKDHTICEDYALGNTKGIDFAYAVVCDGCSASPDVDFGSRCLALSAQRQFRLYQNSPTVLSPQLFGVNSIENSIQVRNIFPHLSSQFLDATMLVAWVKDGEAIFSMYGDGVVIFRQKSTGKVIAHHVQLTSGAPDYLSYLLDPLRKTAYLNLSDNKKIISVYEPTVGIITSEEIPLTPHFGSWKVSEGDVISVISDGINSFRKSDNTLIPWTDLVDEFTGFKNFEGQFVQRRISAFKRKCSKENWHHLDDISIASIVV